MFDDDDRYDTTAEDRQDELDRQRTIAELGSDPDDLGIDPEDESDPWDLYRPIERDGSEPPIPECCKVEP